VGSALLIGNWELGHQFSMHFLQMRRLSSSGFNSVATGTVTDRSGSFARLCQSKHIPPLVAASRAVSAGKFPARFDGLQNRRVIQWHGSRSHSKHGARRDQRRYQHCRHAWAEAREIKPILAD
jgi:hypothetical protein